jgi:hypothetical protein
MCDQDELYEILQDIVFGCSLASGVASLIIIVLYLVFSELRGPSFKVLLYMSLTDLIRSILLSLPFDWQDNKTYCKIAGLIANATISTNAIWSVSICFMLHQIHVYYPEQPKFYQKTWIVTGFLIAPAFQCLPLLTDSYSKNQFGCTYKNDTTGILWRSFQYSFIVISILASILYYVRDFLRLRHLKIFTVWQVVFEKGMIYSVIFLVIICVISIYRFVEFEKSFCEIYGLSILSYSLLALHGFFNFVAIFFNKNLRIVIFSLLKKERERFDSDAIIDALIN